MDDINAISKLLALQEQWMQVVEQQAQVVLPGHGGAQ